MPDPLLDVRDIRTYYGDSYVIQGASLAVPEGRAVALLGRNGMGKTTLIRSIVNLTPPARGEVRLRGELLGRVPPYSIFRKRVALVPQGRRVFASLTVRETLMLPAGAFAAPKREGGTRWPIERVFALFPRLKERVGQFAGSLSGGEQSMLAIGRALMADPDLLLMDEPSEGLAPVIVQQVEEIIGSLKAQGLSILLVEQNVRLATNIADEIYILANGRTVYHDTPAALLADEAAKSRWLGV